MAYFLGMGVTCIGAVAFVWPTTLAAHWGVLDDGWLIRSLAEGHYFFAGWWHGRYFPGFNLFFSAPFALFGPDPLAFFVLEGMCIVLSAVMLYDISWMITRNSLTSLIAPALLLSSPSTAEVAYTVGKPEAPFMLWALVATWAFVRMDTSLQSPSPARRLRRQGLAAAGTLALLLAHFTKETSVGLLGLAFSWPIILLLGDPDRSRRRSRLALVPGLLVAAIGTYAVYLYMLMTQATLRAVSNYTEGYWQSPASALRNLIDYFRMDAGLFLVLAMSVAWMVCGWRRNARSSTRTYSLLWCAAALVFLGGYLGFRWSLNYYLYPVVPFVGLLAATSTASATSAPRRNRQALLAVIALFALSRAYSAPLTYDFARVLMAWSRTNHALLEHLAGRLPHRAEVQLWAGQAEGEIGWQIPQLLKYAWNRDDVVIRPVDPGEFHRPRPSTNHLYLLSLTARPSLLHLRGLSYWTPDTPDWELAFLTSFDEGLYGPMFMHRGKKTVRYEWRLLSPPAAFVSQGMWADGWTGATAHIHARLPETDETHETALVVEGEVFRPGASDYPVVLALWQDTLRIGERALVQNGRFRLQSAPLAARKGRRWAHVVLTCSSTFLPLTHGMHDARELGVRVLSVGLVSAASKPAEDGSRVGSSD